MAVITIPAQALAREIEFAIAYTRACNPARDLLAADRELFSRAIAEMIIERANSGLSGMSLDPG
jgi:hypothetical protein